MGPGKKLTATDTSANMWILNSGDGSQKIHFRVNTINGNARNREEKRRALDEIITGMDHGRYIYLLCSEDDRFMYTMSEEVIGMINDWLNGVHVVYGGGDTRESGEDIVGVLEYIGGFYISRVERRSKRTEGAWVPYFQTFTDNPKLVKAMEEMGLYNFAKPIKHCFVHALEVLGVKYSGTCELFGYLASKDLKRVGELLGVNVSCKTRRKNGDRCRTIKSPTKEGRPCLNIVLINNHYAVDKTLPFTSYSLENFERVKGMREWNKICGIRGSGWVDRNSKKFGVDTAKFFSILEANGGLRRNITHEESVVMTGMDNTLDPGFGDLSYPADILEEVRFKDKKDKKYVFNIFADVETNANNGKHIPYLAAMIYADGESAIPFIGNNCALRMMRYVCKRCEDGDKVRLFFHNLSYDFNFFSEIINLFGKCIKIGASIATADGRFTYMGKTINVTFQDTYKMIPSKLADFGKMFYLTTKKEVISHKMYTEGNIERRYMDVEECEVYMGDRFDEFMGNVRE